MTKFYNERNEFHNEHGPAVISLTAQYWYINDKLHRLDGPAYEAYDGREEFWVDGIEYNSYLEYQTAVELFKQKQLTLA